MANCRLQRREPGAHGSGRMVEIVAENEDVHNLFCCTGTTNHGGALVQGQVFRRAFQRGSLRPQLVARRPDRVIAYLNESFDSIARSPARI